MIGCVVGRMAGWDGGETKEEEEFPLMQRQTCLSDIDRRSLILRLCHSEN